MLMKFVISSGHGKYVRGASGVLDEVDEARKVVEAIADELRTLQADVVTYHDDVSTTQDENLNRIVDFHNSNTRDIDISVHFNAFEPIDGPRGVEVLYLTQQALAANLSGGIANVGGLIDRGPKFRDDLFFLNQTAKPAVLIEVCFVDSDADALSYSDNFEMICSCIALTLVTSDLIS
jgi:N-acetylmuramoyl-L-alanine amidase